LISNAVTFTSEGAVEIGITSTKVSQEGDETTYRIQFLVQDTGIGIAEASIPHLFKSFSQVDSSRTRRHGGTGLGLAISFLLAKAMGGAMWVVSEPGKGSTFGFAIQTTIKTLPKRNSLTPLITRKVSLVSNGNSQKMMQSLLACLGVEARTFSSFTEMAEAGSHQLVVLDSVEVNPGPQQQFIERTPTLHIEKRILKNSEGEECTIQQRGRSNATEIPQLYVSKPLRMNTLRHYLLELIGSSPMSDKSVFPVEEMEVESPKILRILVAEDNKFNQRVLTKVLESLHYSCQVVDNGKDVLKAVNSNRFDVVLMDLRMPEMDGELT
jgi:CheY-like chemotaxis protein